MGRHSRVEKWTDKCGQQGVYPIVGYTPRGPHFRVRFRAGIVGPRAAPTPQPETRAQPNRHRHPCKPELCSFGLLCRHSRGHMGPVVILTAASHTSVRRDNGDSAHAQSILRGREFRNCVPAGVPQSTVPADVS